MIDWNDNAKEAIEFFSQWANERFRYGYSVNPDTFLRVIGKCNQAKTVKDAVEWAGGDWKAFASDGIAYNHKTKYFSYCDIDDLDEVSWQLICTREEFEDYVKEQEGEKWTHKNPPPVGTKCKYALNESSAWWDCEVISHNRLVIHCPHIESVEHCGLQIVGESKTVRFKPIKPTISESEAIGILKVNRHLSFAALLEDYDVVKA